jgi:hypothetical protein
MMQHLPVRTTHARVSTSRRIALSVLAIIVLIALIADQNPAAGVAGAAVSTFYVPLIAKSDGSTAAATATPTATETVTATATPTMIATATATHEQIQTSNLTGTVQLRPRSAQVVAQPVEYAVVLDTSSSMNLNFYGEALDTDGVTKLQCNISSDSVRYTKFQQDIARCQQIGATWLPQSERRIAVAKAALSELIAEMNPFDTMQIVGFNGATAGWIYGTPAGKQQLMASLLTIGATNGDPYTTSGVSLTATSLNLLRERMISAPATSTNGHAFKPVVLLLSGSVPNYFLNSSNPGTGFGWYNDAHDNPSCAALLGRDYIPNCQVGLTNTNPAIERPITAMASQAREIKNLNDGNIAIYAISFDGIPGVGLATDVASQATFPYYSEAIESAQIQQINDAIRFVECVPGGGATWLDTIDSTHTITDTSQRSVFSLPADTSVFGYVYLKDSNGQLLQTAPIRGDMTTGALSYTFTNVAPGAYQQQAFVVYKGDDQPSPIARIYSWILLPDLSHGSSRVFVLNPLSPGGTVPLSPLYLDMQGEVCSGL